MRRAAVTSATSTWRNWGCTKSSAGAGWNASRSGRSRGWRARLLQVGDERRVLGAGQPLLQHLQDREQVETCQRRRVQPQPGEHLALIEPRGAERQPVVLALAQHEPVHRLV